MSWEALSAIGTLGTLGAVGVALGFSIWSERQKWCRDRQRARLVASRLIEPVKALEEGMRSEMVRFSFYNEDDDRSDESHAPNIARLGLLAGSINVEVLQDLFALPNGCAGRLAIALGIIDALARDVEAVMSTGRWSTMIELQRALFVGRWRDQASKGADYLAVVQRELQAAADVIAKLPSPEEIYDEDYQGR
jgi:hypothetical protein